MKITIDTEENDLIDEVLSQVLIVKLKDIKNTLQNWNGYLHKEDKKQNKRIIQACDELLEYYGAT